MTSDQMPPAADDGSPLTRTELDTAHIASRRVADGFLTDLIELADGRAGFGVGLLLNGMIVMGQLASAEDMAAAIDGERRRLVERVDTPDDKTDEEWAQDREHFSTLTTEAYKSYRDELTQLDEDLRAQVGEEEWDFYSIPGKLARRIIAANSRAHLTLQRARIFAPGQSGVTQIAVMRVQLSQVAGWWVLETDAHGNSRTALWETDVPGVSPG